MPMPYSFGDPADDAICSAYRCDDDDSVLGSDHGSDSDADSPDQDY